MARIARIATIVYSGEGATTEEKRGKGLQMLEQASLFRPDIVCLPETFTGLGLGSAEWIATAEEVPGATTKAAGEIARRHRMYVICPIVQREGERIYNSAVVIGREGEVLGAYHKVHPTIGEIEAGITPGTETPVFDTDFGRVGCAICYDLNFRDVIEGLAAKGAEVVFFPSMYCGGLQLRVWAHDFGVFVASAHSGGLSAIVDPLGRVLKWSSIYERILCREVNLDGIVCHIDYNERQWAHIRAKYGPLVEIDIATDEGKFRLVSHHPDVTAQDVVEEAGLERLGVYFERANRIREEALERTHA
jgi:beta-ureidopropionase